ncbi:YcaO-like family protein [Chondromyces apiculatus]|uniref:YcaO domain-containing protein n=1 Tax=Chondromyces apiculatus DSM 436 TaxID=1192034 RepID=A0A017SZ77_9BACT|nr:YcaO-like family protein [Chondromyces apiculatus]EYF01920.1 Hypothetical protein CAP_7688 [Chondromyces apiculatus DSM 436]
MTHPKRRLAPWTVTRTGPDGTFVLGPRLGVLQLSTADLDALSARAWDELVVLGFAEPTSARALSLVSEAALPPPRAGGREAPAPGARPGTIVAGAFEDEGEALARALSAQIPGSAWRVTTELPDAARGALVILLQAIEPRSPDLARALLSRGAEVLWYGEGSEGVHLGPVLRAPRDLDDYLEATHGWGAARDLWRMGFTDGWPVTLISAIRDDVSGVARAAQRALSAPAGSCVLLGGMRQVSLWTTLARAPVTLDVLCSSQTWSKGMLADLRVERAVEVDAVWVASCRSPAGGDAYLEGNFGKGTSPEEARITGVGEAVERFSAFLGSREVRAGEAPPTTEELPLRAFHPFAPAWEAYLAQGEPPVEMTQVRDEVSGRVVRVPATLLHESYGPTHPSSASTGTTSCGLAAYPDRRGAVLRGALETLERDSFYPAFLHQRPAQCLALDDVPDAPRRGDLRDLAGALERLGFSFWLLRYPDARALPIVHAFLLDAAGTAMSRGAGSGYTWATAAVKALLEAVQLREQFALVAQQGPSGPTDDGYVAWAKPEVIAELCAYLRRSTRPDRLVDLPDEAALHARVLAGVGALLVKDLPSPAVDMSAVRVLIPGATCHACPSISAGGAKLLGAAFKHPVPV